jgi:AcrR family transcriptional regulator
MTASTRSRILDAALTLFLRKGVAATRIGEICSKAGVSNGSLFHAFSSKEGIAVALYVGAIGSYQSALLVELSDSRSSGETLRALVFAHWRWIAHQEARARFLFSQGGPGWNAEAEKQTVALNTRMRAAFAAWLAAPQQRAAIRKVPEEAFLPIILGPSMMVTRFWLRTPDPPPPRQLAETFASAALRALLKGPDDE